ncbi:DUF4303 domain-containing protein [Flavobacterium foetidum]|uniref:DUF4303 domain-containing protein n=1 Tax=Flavobacterium foetidum TaxID=2026681 RepID=UPI001074AE48|nr:DUF4303 domain-containing protein [Flavobacterium foetidum]KAF2509114.1 DUF4303 domain-containing protein [Flavobacterium foetidum]
MNWTEFEKKYNFENTVFDLTNQSLDLLSKSEFADKIFQSFAFNCQWRGSISLSFDTDIEVDLRKKGYYPPDWTNELIETEIADIGELWKDKYQTIEMAFDEMIENTDDYDFIDEFSSGFLNSLRRVMVRLESSKAFEKIKTTNNFWTLVTQVDADTDDEEELLDKVRKEYK